jgi:hypothetical protein
MGSAAASLRRPCADCEKMAGDTRIHAAPHEFLVLRRPGSSAVYQCLVCHTNMTCELREPVPRWRPLSGSRTRGQARA